MPLTADLRTWLDHAAQALDAAAWTADLTGSDALLGRLAEAGLCAVGVPESLGGAGGDVTDAVEAIAQVSERSLTAAFVLWGHRTFIEYLLCSPNQALRDRLLPDLMSGRVAGATGLSNAMKFLSGLEELQIVAEADGDGFRLNGTMPWVTNLRTTGFHVAGAVGYGGAMGPFVAALPHDAPGLVRTDDLDLMAMRGSNTAAIKLVDVRIGPEHILTPRATTWLPQVRPAFLGMQCGMSIGLARRSLQLTLAQSGAARHVLHDEAAALLAELTRQAASLEQGLRGGRFLDAPATLFRLRIDLADTVAQATSLELQATGGRAYLLPHGEGFARRWREAAFIPVVTPSLVQLKAALAQQRLAPEKHIPGKAA
jgi:alkylation response protein AidB-like acyl-CoA dehydrogenase